MAKKRKRNTRTKSKKANRGQFWSSIMQFLRNERVQFIIGVLVSFAGIYAFLSIVSFLFTGAVDQTIVNNIPYNEYIAHKTPESNVQSIENWTGAAGAYISEMLVNNWFGLFSMLIPVFIILVGLRIMKVSRLSNIKVFLLTAFGLIAGSITEAFALGFLFPMSHINWGGTHGSQIESLLRASIGLPGTILLIALFVLITVVLMKKSSIYKIQETIIKNKPSFGNGGGEVELELDVENATSDSHNIKSASRVSVFIGKLFSVFKRKKREDIDADIEEDTYSAKSGQNFEHEDQNEQFDVVDKTTINTQSSNTGYSDGNFEVVIPEDEVQIIAKDNNNEMHSQEELNSEGLQVGADTINIDEMEDYDPKKDLSSFSFPTMELLKVYNSGNRAIDMQEQNENKDKIINTLRNYGIEITSIKATVGPTITLYEIIPQAGVRISRIRNLEDDIALSLSALGIRIIAPMPGKGTVGIEVPNKDPQIVSMQSVIASRKFQECDYELPVALGKTITNEVFIFDLAKMPHLLVAGATGQGKSVGLNAIITSLLYKKHPSELKMVLIDPKMVEFNIYSTIEKHYLAKLPDHDKAIITDVSKVTQTLNSLTKEMDDRYELLMRAKVRTIKEYNDKFVKRRLNPNNGHRYMPYIVVVIDEFGDLIMTAGKEIEMPIARIAQKARAVGMHMVIATQRPTTNIITGTIKANFPARMAFRVTSQIDSRTILDATGANQLIGRGDMLFSQGSHLIRIQCAFVDTPEVEDITQYIGTQRGYESAFVLPEVLSNEPEGKQATSDVNERDVLFEEAARLIVIHQQGSTSLIQRKFSVGYNRAGRLMDQLESSGVVGPAQGSKPRDVYVPDEYTLEKLLDSLR